MNITVNAVTKHYPGVTALDDITVELPAGATVGVLGTNGAGKTTLFRVLIGHETPDAGTVTVGDTAVAETGDTIRRQIGFLPDRVGFPAKLTGSEVLEFHATIHGIPQVDRANAIEDVLALVGLEDGVDRRVGGYSHGMRRRLGLAAVLLGEPRILVLDEPTAGLDPMGVSNFHEIIRRIQTERGATILIASHALSEIEQCCDHIVLLHDGKVLVTGRLDELVHPSKKQGFLNVTPSSDAAAASIYESIAGALESATVTEDGLVTAAGDFPILVRELHELNDEWVAGVELTQPGLEDVFHSALSGEVHG